VPQSELLDRRAQAQVASALRSATPLRVLSALLDAPVPSTDGNVFGLSQLQTVDRGDTKELEALRASPALPPVVFASL